MPEQYHYQHNNRISPIVLLADDGYRILTALNGKEAQNLLQTTTEEIKVILMDWMMPEMNGHEATREIRRLEQDAAEDAHIPIIGVTAHVLPLEIARHRSGRD